MKNKGIVIFLIVLAIVIVGVMVGDWYSKRPDNMEGNKFAYSVDEFKEVKDRRFVMEALNQGIELNLMSARLKDYKGIAYWYKLKKEYDPYRDRAASICLLAEGRTDELRYDYVSLIRNLYRRVNADVEKHSFCSEFVQWVLQESGILEKHKKALRPGEFAKLGVFHPRVMIYSWK